MKLTQLQCIGISTMLMNIKNHGSEWLTTGDIKFIHSTVPSKYITMLVIIPEPDIVYQFTLSRSENIDCDIEYHFQYDTSMDMFRIIQNETVVGEA